MAALRELIFRGHDPYAGFDPSLYPGPLQSWAYDHPIVEHFIAELPSERS